MSTTMLQAYCTYPPTKLRYSTLGKGRTPLQKCPGGYPHPHPSIYNITIYQQHLETSLFVCAKAVNSSEKADYQPGYSWSKLHWNHAGAVDFSSSRRGKDIWPSKGPEYLVNGPTSKKKWLCKPSASNGVSTKDTTKFDGSYSLTCWTRSSWLEITTEMSVSLVTRIL